MRSAATRFDKPPPPHYTARMRFFVHATPARLSAVFLWVFALCLLGAAPAFAQHGCSSGNLLSNCDFNNFQNAPGFGSVPAGWTPFILSGSAAFVEATDTYWGAPSLQIWSNGDTFQAGVYYQVRNVIPGATYVASVGWAAPNEPNAFGRKLGIDPTGGSDPRAPSVVWGPMHYGPGRFGNYSSPSDPNIDVRAVARADTVTVFFFVDHNYSTGANIIFVDALGLTQDTSQPVAAPPTAPPLPPPVVAAPPTRVPATATPTATPSPTPTPTATPTPSPTPTDTPTATPSPTATATPTSTPTATRPPRATVTPTAAAASLMAMAGQRPPMLLPLGLVSLGGAAGIVGLLRRRRRGR